MDALTEMKEHIAREERIEEEKYSMIKSTHENMSEIKERITRLGEENRELIIENASLKEEIHELRDEEMKAIKDADEDRKEMKKIKGENEKLKDDKIYLQSQIIHFTQQLKKEKDEKLKLEVALTGDEPIQDLSKEFDIIMKRLSKIKTRTVENSVPRKEYQFK